MFNILIRLVILNILRQKGERKQLTKKTQSSQAWKIQSNEEQ